LANVLIGLGDCRWVNDPVAAARCEYKPVQLAAAAAAGLAIPPTIITSSPQHAYDWATSLGRPVVYKPLDGIWHADDGQVRVVYTTVPDDPRTLPDPASGRTAQLIQQQIPRRTGARAVAVGETVLALLPADRPAARGEHAACQPP
jgi:hypothetical protein